MSQVSDVAEKENQDPMAAQVITMEPKLNLCLCGMLFTFNKYSEFLASLVICIHATVGLWRMDSESFFWLCLKQIIFYVTLLAKYCCHFVVSMV